MSQRKTPSRKGAGAAASGVGTSPAALPAHQPIPAAKRSGSGRAPGRNPRKGSKERPGESSCPRVEDNSHSGPADTSRANSANHTGGSGRKIGTSRAAGDKGSSTSRAASTKGTYTSRAVGDKGSSTSRAASTKGTYTSRAVGDKGSSTSRAASTKGTYTSRAVGDKGSSTSRAASTKGTYTSRAVGDDGTCTSRDGSNTSRAASTKGRAVGEASSERDLNFKALKNVVENLRIRSDQKSRAAKRVNDVVDHLLRYIKKDSAGYFAAINKLSSGSYYENVKISAPNEFDIMVTVPINRIECMEADSEGAYYQVAFKRTPRGNNPLNEFVCNGTLSAERMLGYLRKLIKAAATSLPEYHIKVKRKKTGCPAVTLQIEEKDHLPISLDMVLALEVRSQSWPSSTKDGLKIEDWLGKKVRRDFRNEPFYLVPKQPLDATPGTQTQLQKDMWRISFSHIEKKMLLNHGSLKTCCENGSLKCCRKSCLKLLKNLIQKLKEKKPRKLSSVCSYHAKTTLLHACVKRPKDELWSFENLANCFFQLLDNFIDHLQRADLPHFFIPSYNLFNPRIFDAKGRDTLLHLIESEKKKGFPIFITPSNGTTVTSYST
uniref:cyclic GMP-AMP synthase n=1 Tax=Pristiophorus japonicus TaxID=55135 RepID=UPI00398EC299